MHKDIPEKCKRIREWLKRKGYDGLLITSQASFSWLTGGRGFIGLASERACGSILVTTDRLVLFVNNIEANRLQNEELEEDYFEVIKTSWFSADEEKAKLEAYTSQYQHIVHEEDHLQDVIKLRSVLTMEERESYHHLGQDAAEVLEEVCHTLSRGDTEYQVAGQLAKACYERGIEPILTLIAADERAFYYRHPLPTSKMIDHYVLLALGARRKGLVASLSRLVHFGSIPEALARKHRAVAAVDGLFIEHTRPGVSVSDIFNKGARSYEAFGFKEEWQNHHQGGMTGYLSREYRATPDSTECVELYQAFAWNPSIAGVKSEDTLIVGETNNLIVTRTEAFPEIEISVGEKSLVRPAILERKHQYAGKNFVEL
ncbi:Xaa-Pro aminopeptidase [Pullulanibacillus pueri]|uniref:Peptidase M24 n=1 Tax=Pullulanibacillus pueri TaxID=1437324 RepID=A0A8J2ZXZ2_9BACL|nr:aminopeptidase P family protein [Pullulanibacillus pueri]MBM7682974.1 Xaa-Pro aminopeptidase [Pullulanibacillus pueri]GGH85985.1 peptidase M24 [Pullulanibacillus pueri]